MIKQDSRHLVRQLNQRARGFMTSSEGRLFLVALVVAESLFFFLLNWEPVSFFGGFDYARYHAFTLSYLGDSLAEGRIPFWNPHIALGMPFAAYAEPSVFYPVNWLLAVIPVAGWIYLTFTLHFALSFTFLYLLARKFGLRPAFAVAAPFLFLFSTAIMIRVSIGHIHVFNTLAYLPVVLYASCLWMERATMTRFFLLSAVFFLQILSGHLQFVWITCIITGVAITGLCLENASHKSLSKWARVAAGILGAFILAAGGTLFFLMPLFEMAGQSVRASGVYAGILTQTFDSLGSLFIPPWSGFHASQGTGGLMPLEAEQKLFMGTLPLLFGFAGLSILRERVNRALALLAVVCLLLAFSRSVPLNSLYVWAIPGFDTFRAHCRFGIGAILALSFAAPLFAQRLASDGERSAQLRILTAMLIYAGYLFLAFVGDWFVAAGPVNQVRLAAVPALGLGLMVVPWQRMRPVAVYGLLGCLVVIHACEYWANIKELSVLRAANRNDAVALVQQVYDQYAAETTADAGGESSITTMPVRFYLPPDLVYRNTAMVVGYSTPHFYTPMAMTRQLFAYSRLSGLDSAAATAVFSPKNDLSYPPFQIPDMSISLGFDGSKQQFVARDDPDPRFYLATFLTSGSWPDYLAFRLKNPDDTTTAWLDVDHPLAKQFPTTFPNRGDSVRLLSYKPEELVFTVNTAGPRILVARESYYPGWKYTIARATDSGEPILETESDSGILAEADCMPVNIWMRGALVPPGKYIVRIYYDPEVFFNGLRVSLVFALGACAGAWMVKRRRRASDASSEGGHQAAP